MTDKFIINSGKTLIVALAATIILILIGCATQKNAEKYYRDNKEKLAEQCADKFPAKDSIYTRDSTSFDTIYLEVEPVTLTDTFLIKGETVTMSKKCPPVKVITKTIQRDSIIIRRDRAMEYVLQFKVDTAVKHNAVLTYKLSEAQQKIGKKNKKILFLSISLLALLLFIFRKPIIGAARKLITVI